MIKNCIYETWHNLYSKVHLRRCTKCILPATMPFINFNEQGVCNYCTSHKKVIARGHEELKKIILPYRSNNGADDCIVAFTGGRDSSYSLHYVKTVLKMHPVAFTYDCGMATEIAQRNRKRMCDALGVKQIIVAVDGTIKRKNIKKNINAWLRRPDLGMIPLFMAGDKQIIHYARKVKKKTGIPLIFYGLGNRHEDALFKLGFSQVYTESPMLYYNISLLNKVKFAAYYAKQYLANPRYINHSLFDALYGYFCLFFLGKQNGDMFLYDYVKWDENKIMATLINDYKWEHPQDTIVTWRIDDGTSAFYNYIYMTVAGFTENDTFRSNQIREGEMTREDALQIVKEENKPRCETIEWYACHIGFDCDTAIKRINTMPKLYA